VARAIEDWMIPLIKGMIARGDDHSDIAAWFLINQGRISEIKTGNSFLGERASTIQEAPSEQLPPTAPTVSPYEILKAQSGLWAARVALQGVQEKIEKALVAVENAENRMKTE